MGNALGTIVTPRKERVAVFVDACNLYPAAKAAFAGGNLDYGALLKYATANCELVIARAYVARNPADPGQYAFFEAISYHGFEPVFMELRTHPDGSREADWDVGLALDVYIIATEQNLDRVVLVSGDGDFVPLVQKLLLKSCHTTVMSFDRCLSRALVEVADAVILLDNPIFQYAP